MKIIMCISEGLVLSLNAQFSFVFIVLFVIFLATFLPLFKKVNFKYLKALRIIFVILIILFLSLEVINYLLYFEFLEVC